MSRRTLVVDGVTLQVKIPRPPNFLIIDDDGHSLPLSGFSDDALMRVAHEFGRGMVARAEEQRRKGVES